MLTAMSYDIVVFEPSAVADEHFARWWAEQSEWGEAHDYDDVAVTTPALRRFYDQLRVAWPPMNGPDAPSDDAIDSDAEVEGRLTDYAIGTQLIYLAFAWSLAPEARADVLRAAASADVAVALVSDDGTIVRP